MKNPLKMNPVEKRLLLGGIATSLIYHMNDYAQTEAGYPAELNSALDSHLPNNGQILADIAPPIVLEVVKRYKRNEKIVDMTFGSELYAIPNLIVRTGVKTLATEGANARPPATRASAPIPVRNNIPPPRTVTPTRPSTSKYILTT